MTSLSPHFDKLRAGLPLSPSKSAGEGVVIVACARSWVGTPFHANAALKGIGCDCAGLLIGIVRETGLSGDSGRASARFARLERLGETVSYSGGADVLDEILAALAMVCDPASEPLPGDFLVFRVGTFLPHHMGVFCGDTFIHAYDHPSVKMVVESPVAGWMDRVHSVWRCRFAASLRSSQ